MYGDVSVCKSRLKSLNKNIFTGFKNTFFFNLYL